MNEVLSSPVIRSRMVWQCWQRLDLFGRSNNVTLHWVPGNIGVEENVANELARKGTTTPLVGPEPSAAL